MAVFKRQDRSIAGRVVPHAVFVDPAVASVGVTEHTARDAGHAVGVGRREFAGAPRHTRSGRRKGSSSSSSTPTPTGC
jgi:pyruvate/2-oxoglutarate dehydrogenase complex dihydrolipoamide dehydrogenase (E3) component